MNKWRYLYYGIILGALAIALFTTFTHIYPINQTKQNPQKNTSQSQSTSDVVKNIFIIVEENKSFKEIVGNKSAPYINDLINKYGLAKNYHAITHPSLPNYIALTSGSTYGITSDCNPPSAGCTLDVPNIVDRIEKSGKTWKAYMESMPTNCFMYNSGDYVTKHNPFVYYQDITSDSARCNSHVVPFSRLVTDLSSVGTTPNYAFISPNICNDMHDCGIGVADNWLSKTVPGILNFTSFKSNNSLLLITWDEGDINDDVPMIIIGPKVKPGYKSDKSYNHYSVLKTIESEWGLDPLTNKDKNAADLSEFYR